MSVTLPRFTDHLSHDKLMPLTEEIVCALKIEPIVVQFLHNAASATGDLGRLRVLDFGCGRGVTVAALQRLGFQAFGVDVQENYLESARRYFIDEGAIPSVSLLDANGRSVFPDGFFDVVLTNQVIEHVVELDAVVHEISRLTAPGGSGLHIYPARFCPVEPHIFVPFAHWLQDGSARRALIKTALAVGVGAQVHREYGLDDRTEIFARFCRDETYYRRLGAVQDVFRKYGFKTHGLAREKLCLSRGAIGHLASLPIVGATLGRVYQTFRQVYLKTVRLAPAAPS